MRATYQLGLIAGAIISLVIIFLFFIGSFVWYDYGERKDIERIRVGTSRKDVEFHIGSGTIVPQQEVPTVSHINSNGAAIIIPAVEGPVIIKYRTQNCIIFVAYDRSEQVIGKHVQDLGSF